MQEDVLLVLHDKAKSVRKYSSEWFMVQNQINSLCDKIFESIPCKKTSNSMPISEEKGSMVKSFPTQSKML